MLRKELSLSELKQCLSQKWPEAIKNCHSDNRCQTFVLPQLQTLLPQGIPAGQMLEIVGNASSGKTSFLLKLLSNLSRQATIAYIDFAGSFYPAAAQSSGNDINHFLLVQPENLAVAMRAGELLLEQGLAQHLVFDLITQTEPINRILLHRLRQQIVRNRGLVFFLTEDNTNLIPASQISLRLGIERETTDKISISVRRSRISREGAKMEFRLQ